MKHVIAKYLRLSLEDEKEKESESIYNQRILLDSYINHMPEFLDYEILEFIDDGFTGTNTNRPEFKRMIEKINHNEIQCVIVKDFSRFSRNYLDLGEYLEKVFPTLGIRFIAVNEGYDSKDLSSCLDISVKGLVYDMQSRDLSRKIKSVKNTQMKNAIIVGGSSPYGYQKIENKKPPYIVDEAAAEIVRCIFKMIIDRATFFEIARKLTMDGVPSPSLYKLQKGEKIHQSQRKMDIWSVETIKKIVKDERYKGTLILGRQEIVHLHKIVLKPEEKWYRFENYFEPIITKEQFQQVQEILKARKRESGYLTKKKEIHLLSGKVKCPICNMSYYHKISTKKKINKTCAYFYCRTPLICSSTSCFRGKISEDKLIYILTYIIKKQMDILNKSQQIYFSGNENYEMEKELMKINQLIEENFLKRRNIYENMKRREINEIYYQSQRNLLAGEEEELNMKKEKIQMLSLQKENAAINCKSKTQSFQLTREIVKKLIKKILIYDEKKISIHLSYCEGYSNIKGKSKEMKKREK